MQFLDFSPPTSPTLDQQRDALQKGLGRALQWAASGKLAMEPLLNACLHDQRFDRQCEDNRGEWLWKIITGSNAIRQIRDCIIDALRSVDDERDACQLCELALHFALSGDEGFRQQLYVFVGERQIPDSPEIGEDQLLRLGGEEALRFVARLRGRNLVNADWQWHDSAVMKRAIADFGEQRVQELLMQSSEPEILRYASGWKEHQTLPIDPEIQRQAHIRTMKAVSVSDVILAAHGKEQPYWLRTWGKHADKKDLEIILNHIWTEQSPAVIAKLLRVYSDHPLPIFDSRLIELCRHSDDDVRRWAFNSLEQNSHPLVREFAFQELRHPTLDRPVVNLLIKNFEEGDEQRLLDQVELPDDPCLRHWMLIDVVHLLEQNDAADRSKLGQLSYFHTPCQECRFYAARLLFDRNIAPSWLVEECRSDANEDTRTLGDPECSIGDMNNESH